MTPRTRLLLLDLDWRLTPCRARQWHEKVRGVLEMLDVKATLCEVKTREDGARHHVTICLDRMVPRHVALAAEVAMGSDPVRGLRDLIRGPGLASHYLADAIRRDDQVVVYERDALRTRALIKGLNGGPRERLPAV